MAKGYILADIPKNCEECDYARLINGETACTAANLRRKTEKERPEWCPIQKFPEEKPESELKKADCSGKEVWRVPLLENIGWNACLKEMLGKCQESCPYLEHDKRTDEFICHSCGFSKDTECPVPDPSICPARINIHGNSLRTKH